MNNLLTMLKGFKTASKGSVIIIFAFWLIPALLFTVVAIEVSQYLYVQTRVATAVDAAALAAARFEPANASANGQKIFYANLKKTYMGMNLVPTITVSTDQTQVTVTIKDKLPTLFAKSLTNIASLPMNVSATVAREILGLEVALVLDQTGSMAGQKISDLKTAANNFVNTLFGTKATLDNVVISVVPYVMSVNIGNTGKTQLMVDTLNTRSGLATFPTNVLWKGCVKARNPSGNGELTDDTATTLGKWTIYRAESTYNPTKPQTLFKTTDADWGGLKTPGDSTNAYRVYVSGASANKMFDTATGSLGPNQYCGEPILPLTNVKADIQARINALNADYSGSGTASNLGLVWGWRTISPKWAGRWDSAFDPKPYGSSDRFKAIIMMTDGESQWVGNNRDPDRILSGDVSAYRTEAVPNRYTTNNVAGTPAGSLANPKAITGPVPAGGVNDLDTSKTYLNDQLSKLCTSIKAQGIEIFVVIFGSPSGINQSLYQNCSSSKPGSNYDHYYTPATGSDLNTTFVKIANKLKRTRIIK